MANITTSQVADSTPTIVAAQALGYLKANTVLARLVNRDYENEVAQYGNVVKIPYGGSLSVNDKSGGSVVTLQQPDDAVYTLTLNKHKEVSFLIEDLAKAFARPDWFSVYAADAMAVLAEQIDADIAALYSGLSQTIDATAGLSEGTFREARRLLNSAKAPLENRVAVLHEDAEYEMLGIEKVVNRDYAESLGSKAAGAFTGRFMGFDVFLDQKIVATGGQCKNLFFHRNAIVMANRPLPTAPAGMGAVQRVMNEDGIAIRVTMSYDHDYLGAKFTLDTLYGVAEMRDSHGVAVSTDEI
ncbi:MAG TPA: P22 phage major capsid protein family protein [Anaerolineales bacterium]|nr:P22 phage major capsid protein family protein [Anaerolineales bacterium]